MQDKRNVTYFLYIYNIKTSIITPRRPKTAPKTATRRTLLPNQAGAALAAIGKDPLFGTCTITGIMLDLKREEEKIGRNYKFELRIKLVLFIDCLFNNLGGRPESEATATNLAKEPLTVATDLRINSPLSRISKDLNYN